MPFLCVHNLQAFGFKCNSRLLFFACCCYSSSLFGFVWVKGVIRVVVVTPMVNVFMGEHPKGSVGKMTTIISINGGGVHGLILATILHELEAKFQVNHNQSTPSTILHLLL
jgi:hypothetical protein